MKAGGTSRGVVRWGCILLFAIALKLLPSCSENDRGADEQRPPDQPNILLIVADDMGWGDLSLRGNPNVRTPHLDALARGGVEYARFYVSVVCAPTRAELLTGRHAVRYGVTGTSAGRERLDTGVVTLPEVLAKAGYATGLFGKWHNGTQAPYHPLTRGFERFYGFTSGHWGRYADYVIEDQEDIAHFDGYLPDVLTDTAAAWIEAQETSERDAPWFAMLTFPTPHSPMQVPDVWYDRVAARGLDSLGVNPSGEAEDRAFTTAALAMVENLDHNVGRLVARLERLGLRQNTLIVFLSDNGPNSWRWNAGLPGKKGILEEGGLRSPLVLSWPGVLTQQTSHEAHTVRDLPRTITTLAGISEAASAELGGHSMLRAADSMLLAVRTQHPRDFPSGDLRSIRTAEERAVVSQWLDGVSVLLDGYRLLPDGRVRRVESATTEPSPVPPALQDTLRAIAARFRAREMRDYNPIDTRPFTVGYPGLRRTLLPVRDAEPTGGAARSSRWPNDSYFACGAPSAPCGGAWPVHVATAGDYRVRLYYDFADETPPSATPGVTLASSVGMVTASLSHPPLPDTLRTPDAELDRVVREESDTRRWWSAPVGKLPLAAGGDTLRVQFGEGVLVWAVTLERV